LNKLLEPELNSNLQNPEFKLKELQDIFLCNLLQKISKTKEKIPNRAAKNDHKLLIHMLRRSEIDPSTLWPINGSLGFKGKNVY